MFKFSENLRNEAIAYFGKKLNLPISGEEADLYLEALSSLILIFGEGGIKEAGVTFGKSSSSFSLVVRQNAPQGHFGLEANKKAD